MARWVRLVVESAGTASMRCPPCASCLAWLENRHKRATRQKCRSTALAAQEAFECEHLIRSEREKVRIEILRSRLMTQEVILVQLPSSQG